MATESIFQEDPPERVDADNPLDELPDTNDKNYPQENKAYFEKKNYCCTDKYDLEDFVCNGVDLPSLEKVFQLNPKAIATPNTVETSKAASLEV